MPFRPRNTTRARELRHAATPAERLLWTFLNRSQLGAKFSRQMPIGPFFADFLCREARLVVELDGFSHDVAPDRDVARDRYLGAAGYRVLRFANEDVLRNTEGVLVVIRQALAETLAHPRPLPQAGGEQEGFGPQAGGEQEGFGPQAGGEKERSEPQTTEHDSTASPPPARGRG